MKLIARLFVLLFCLGLSGLIHAQSEQFMVKIKPGVLLPMGDFSKIAGTAFGADADFLVFLNKTMALSAGVGYYSFADKGDNPLKGVYKAMPVSLSADFYLKKDKKLRPFFGVGMVYISFSQEVQGEYASFTDRTGKVGFLLKGGFHYALNNIWGIQALARYYSILDYSQLNFSLGVSYRF